MSYLATQFYSGFYLPAPPSLYFPGGKGRQGNPTVLLFYFTGSWGSSLGWPGAFLKGLKKGGKGKIKRNPVNEEMHICMCRK